MELEAVPPITYVPPTGVSLAPVSGAMAVTCHVSPDAGWRVLRPFLRDAGAGITLGMYDFTAPHIYRAVRRLLRDTQVVWRQTLGARESLPSPEDIDSTKADDKPEASIIRGLTRVAPTRFENAFAQTGNWSGRSPRPITSRSRSATGRPPGSRAGTGSRRTSRSPTSSIPTADRELIRDYNREWHLVVEQPRLGRHVRARSCGTTSRRPGSSEEAIAPPLQPVLPDLLVPLDELLEAEAPPTPLEVFAPERFEFDDGDPLTIQPILTPDNYLEVVARAPARPTPAAAILPEPVAQSRPQPHAGVGRAARAAGGLLAGPVTRRPDHLPEHRPDPEEARVAAGSGLRHGPGPESRSAATRRASSSTPRRSCSAATIGPTRACRSTATRAC